MRYSVDLQKALMMQTTQDSPPSGPHHPMTCLGELRLEDDGTLKCPHNSTRAGGDRRTKDCINGSVALLIIELAQATL